MKNYFFPLIMVILVSCGGSGDSQEPDTSDSTETTSDKDNKVELIEEQKEKRKSPRISDSFTTGDLTIKIDYGSPRVRGRKIWGDLVPYDKVWRAGADEATAITFDQDVEVEGNPIAAGTYGLYVIPKENEDWTFIFNEEWSKKKHDVWGAFDYAKEKDVLRINVTPEFTKGLQEDLRYEFNGNTFIFWWEYVRCKFEITL